MSIKEGLPENNKNNQVGRRKVLNGILAGAVAGALMSSALGIEFIPSALNSILGINKPKERKPNKLIKVEAGYEVKRIKQLTDMDCELASVTNALLILERITGNKYNINTPYDLFKILPKFTHPAFGVHPNLYNKGRKKEYYTLPTDNENNPPVYGVYANPIARALNEGPLKNSNIKTAVFSQFGKKSPQIPDFEKYSEMIRSQISSGFPVVAWNLFKNDTYPTSDETSQDDHGFYARGEHTSLIIGMQELDGETFIEYLDPYGDNDFYVQEPLEEFYSRAVYVGCELLTFQKNTED